jgi:predicted ribosome quality control (RQC) complex YloA/Tae2 family protein
MRLREFVLSSGRKICGGKDSFSNDELVRLSGREDVLVHTEMPGSPFVNLGARPNKKELYEGAVFCAKFSQAWRDSKRGVVVDIFLRRDMKKDTRMKEGTWRVVMRDKVSVKKVDILRMENKLDP